MESAPPAHDRLLPWIAAERTVRALLLLGVGAVLVTHPHANWASELTSVTRRLGLDPNGNWIRRLLNDVRHLRTSEDVLFGIIALAYGVLEGAEAYGLWRRRRWGEWLTVLATSLLLIPELWELTKSTTTLKVLTLLLNIAVVAYLLWRLHRRRPAGAPAPGHEPARETARPPAAVP